MALFPLKIPPGVVNNGLQSASSGRWRLSNLIRWINGVMQPWRGWRLRIDDTVTGLARSILTWKNNAGDPLCAIATHSHIYALDVGGTLSDITPGGFTAGIADSSVNLGYGGGLYGRGPYGTPRSLTSTPISATVPSLETWGEHLLICSPADGKIYEYALDPLTPPAVVTNAPDGCTAILVTAERSLVAIAPDGNPRRLMGSDLQDNTEWTPSDTTQAWIQDVQTAGKLIRGVQLRGPSLYFTNIDVHAATYVGPPYVYQFERVGIGCGLIAPGAVAVVDTGAVWMSDGGFWAYDGSVQPLPCDVQDYVFSDLNTSQRAKITTHHKSQQGEVVFYYPSAGSIECDKYVAYAYREKEWSVGELARTCGVDNGAFTLPMAVDPDGQIWEHEVGMDYPGATSEPFAETGEIQIGNSDNVMLVKALNPDDETLGDVNLTFYVRDRPDSDDTTYGPYTASVTTFLRFTARKARLRVTGVRDADWRWGQPELDIQAGGRR